MARDHHLLYIQIVSNRRRMSSERKRRSIMVRMTEAHWRVLRALARSRGLGLSTMLLCDALEVAARRSVLLDPSKAAA